MSATGRGGKREKDYVYETPEALASTIAQVLDCKSTEAYLEPSAGSGVFVRALLHHRGVHMDAIDARPDLGERLLEAGAANVRSCRFEDYHRRPYDWIIGNPPFSMAQSHVQQALFLLRPGGHVAFILRLNFLGSTKRIAFFRENPPWRVYTLPQRPDFTGGGADATEYAVIVWRKGFEGPPVMDWLSWKDTYATERDEDLRRIRARDWRR